MAHPRRSSAKDQTHQMFRGLFEDWRTRAGVLSATPDAPVVPDDSRGILEKVRKVLNPV
ncbi:hypothetical protein ABZ896_17770 [Streptomyces sp. NPDC047072]|uniref:hypothetical protein n=1 Tax=Streptomyces sp. NPDC047072 TaxID=3154809 RepID=UPI003411AB49